MAMMQTPVDAPLGPAMPAPPPGMQQGNPMDALVGQPQLPMSPQQAEIEAQAGALQQIKDMELAFQTLSDMAQQMAGVYPGAAEPVRQVMESLAVAKQSLLGILVPMYSSMPDAQPRGQAYMGG